MKRSKSRLAKALRYALLLVAAVYTLVPIIALAITAIRSEADLNQGPFTIPTQLQALANFERAWSVGRIGVYAGNSLMITATVVALVVCCTTVAGYAFAKLSFPGRDGLFYLLLLGMMVPFQAMMIPIYFLFNSLHLLNTRLSVILVLAVDGLPFGTFLMRSFIRGIPDELSESAKLDGCGELRIFRSIILPLTSPAWMSLIIFQSMWAWNNFIVPLMLVYDEKIKPIPLGLMYFQGRYTTEYTVIAAAVIISILPLVLVYIAFQRHFTMGITAGALKG